MHTCQHNGIGEMMESDVLKEILDQLKLQTAMVQDSMRKNEELSNAAKTRMQKNDDLIKLQKKEFSFQKVLSIALGVILLGSVAYPRIMSWYFQYKIANLSKTSNKPIEERMDDYEVSAVGIRSMFESGDYKKIAEVRDRLFPKHQFNPDIYFYVGASLFNQGNVIDAKPYFEKSDSLFPDLRNEKYLNAIKTRINSQAASNLRK